MKRHAGGYIELDFHNMTTDEAINEFISTYNSLCPGGTIKIVHGYGSTGVGGKIRKVLMAYLNDHTDYLTYEYENEGCTLVYPNKPLPEISEILTSKILEYCDAGAKTEEKILGKFYRYGYYAVHNAIFDLMKQEKLQLFYKGKYKLYGVKK